MNKSLTTTQDLELLHDEYVGGYGSDVTDMDKVVGILKEMGRLLNRLEIERMYN